MKRLHVLLPATAALIALACPVHAQWAWQWRDEKGQMVYSDVAPPPSIPPSRIIRNPNGQMTTAYEAPAHAGLRSEGRRSEGACQTRPSRPRP